MLSATDLERLIAVKRREIEKEKTLLGLISLDHSHKNDENKENHNNNNTQNVRDIVKPDSTKCKSGESHVNNNEREESVSPELERYIRRYLGLPVMLKTGEYSPNNPLLRNDRDNRSERDVFIGLGEYDERKKSLRRLRQQEYREYLDQQAKKKKEEKEKAERELRLIEERERKKIEEIQQRELRVLEEQNRQTVNLNSPAGNNHYISRRPLSVACQTDENDFLPIHLSKLTEAERELSPRAVIEVTKTNPDERPIKPAPWQDLTKFNEEQNQRSQEMRRRSYGDFDERAPCGWRTADDSKYRPSILDADAVHQRNLKAQQEASERKQFYQKELKCQIEEQQRIREERKAREKMLEMAEIRRLEEQLRMLGVATGNERHQHKLLTDAMHQNSLEYDQKQKLLLKCIDDERKYRPERSAFTSRSDDTPLTRSKLPHHYKPLLESTNEICTNRKPFSINIPETSVFSTNYDVDYYLRKNLNPKSEKSDIFDALPLAVSKESAGEKFCNENSSAMDIVENKWKVPLVQKNIVKSRTNNGKNINILTQLGSIRRQLQLEQIKLDKMLDKDSV